MGAACVFGALLENVLLGFTFRDEIAVHANVSTADYLCHYAASFGLLSFWRSRSIAPLSKATGARRGLSLAPNLGCSFLQKLKAGESVRSPMEHCQASTQCLGGLSCGDPVGG